MSDEKKENVTFTPPPAILDALKAEAAEMGCPLADFMKGFCFQAARDPNGATLKLRLRTEKELADHPLLPLGEEEGVAS